MKRFKLKNTTLAIGMIVGLVASGPASATLLDLPIQFPFIAFDNTGTLNYDATMDALSVTASPIAIRLEPAAPPVFIVPDTELGEIVSINIAVDAAGNLIGGNPDGPDLVVIGAIPALGITGVLLTGEISGFGFGETGATDLFDFTFTKSEGGLLNDILLDTIVVTLQSERSTFAGSFESSFGGGAKGTLGNVPEPGTMLLVGAGLLGLTHFGRRRSA